MPPLRSKTERVALGVVAGVLVIAGLWHAWQRLAIPDVSWPLYLASRVLQGARHGVDFFEVNPPLFIWLSIPPVLLGRVLEVSPWHASILFVGVLAGLSLLLTHQLLKLLVSDERERWGLVLTIVFAMFLLPGHDLVEREHLAFTLTAPFVLLAAARAKSVPVAWQVSVLCGLLGGVGFLLKPYFLPVLCVLLLYVFHRSIRVRTLLPEMLTVVLVGAGYLGGVLALAPGYPSMAARLWPTYNNYLDNGIVLTLAIGGVWLPLALLCALSARVITRAADVVLDILAVATATYYWAAIVQQKGFGYHYLAASAFALVMLSRLWGTLRGYRLRRSVFLVLATVTPVVGAAIALPALAKTVRGLASPSEDRYLGILDLRELLPLVRELAGGRPVMVLSSNPASAWPLVTEAGAQWSSRYMSLWPLVSIYADQAWRVPRQVVRPRKLSARTGFERRFSQEVVTDFEQNKPQVVVVFIPDTSVVGWGGAAWFDYVEYFAEDPRFREAMERYSDAGTVGHFRILVRHDDEQWQPRPKSRTLITP